MFYRTRMWGFIAWLTSPVNWSPSVKSSFTLFVFACLHICEHTWLLGIFSRTPNLFTCKTDETIHFLSHFVRSPSRDRKNGFKNKHFFRVYSSAAAPALSVACGPAVRISCPTATDNQRTFTLPEEEDTQPSLSLHPSPLLSSLRSSFLLFPSSWRTWK